MNKKDAPKEIAKRRQGFANESGTAFFLERKKGREGFAERESQSLLMESKGLSINRSKKRVFYKE